MCMPKSQSKFLLMCILAYNERFDETGDYSHSSISYELLRYKRQLICNKIDSNFCYTCEYHGSDERDYPGCKISRIVSIIINQ